jgi:hypothetical protein
MRGYRLLVATSIAAVATLGIAVTAEPAYAAVPANDTIQTATEITTVPFTDTVDTTEATTDAFETSLNADCGAPAVEHGVWYHATITQSGTYTADTSQSDYGTGIMVLAGPANAPTFLTCGPRAVTGPLTAGQDVFLLVFGDGTTTATSGTMVLTVEPAAPAPTVNLTVAPRGSFGRDGSVTIHGTISCTGDGRLADVSGQMSQRVGRALFFGLFDTQPAVVCDGTPQPWTGTASPQNGLFRGGHLNVDVSALVCDGSCGSAEVTATVQLKSQKK